MEYDPSSTTIVPFDPLGRRLARPSVVQSSDFTFGMEEEYFLAEIETLESVPCAPDAFFEEAARKTEGRITREFLGSQIEAVTRPHADIAEMRRELAYLRRELADVAAGYGLAILASGTHPTALWRDSLQSPKERYDKVMDDLQMIGQRNMLCGMHVHVELPDPDRRVEIMSRMTSYVPLFLALSTSSPFWQAHNTGLKGYRLAAYDELPRTGLPEHFRTSAEYDAYVEALVLSGIVPNASHIWWAMRPSTAHDTLELRAPDCTTRIDDAVAIAALYRTLARHLYYAKDLPEPTSVSRALAVENKWQAQRNGVHSTFATEAGPVAFGDFLDTVIGMISADAAELGCLDEVRHCQTIARNGTAADAQLEIFQQSVADNGSEKIALRKVLAWIAATTAETAS